MRLSSYDSVNVDELFINKRGLELCFVMGDGERLVIKREAKVPLRSMTYLLA